ncbi:MAG: LuxR C-terminal-related transcriptional regulator [Anaerolineales bacterium]
MNLPVQLTSFIGRESDLANVLLGLSQARCVTITGTGGSGKTRLALQTANKVSNDFEDGVWWVDLSPLNDPTLLSQLIVQALGMRPIADQPMQEALIGFLRSKQLLLVLDNCEHQNAACAQLARQMLLAAPALHILATSREPLGIEGEARYPISGLPWPAAGRQANRDEQERLDLNVTLNYDAVKLFVERARSITPSFSLTHENAPAVVEICQRLDGLPLALELASARVNVLTVQEIAARLNDRLSLLTSGKRREFEPRHQTLKAAIDWSYALLTAEEQILLRRLAVFAAGCSLDTAEAICSGEEILPAQILDLLASLVDKSLVIAETSGRAPARYRLLETIRAYAFEKLNEAGEVRQLRDRHLDLFVARAEEAMPKQFEAYQQLWLNWLETEHDNLRAALVWALESKRIEAGLRLASALTYFWEIHGYVQEGLGWMERLLAAADENVPLDAHVNALVFATFHYMLLGNAQAATSYARRAVDLAEAAEEVNSPVLAFARDGLASAAKTAGDYQTAFDISEQNIRYYRQSGPPAYLGICLLSQGENALQIGNYEIARERLDEGLALARRDGDAYRIAHSLNTLGDLARLEQNYTEAASVYESGAELLRELNAQRDLASLLSNLGYARLYLGEVEQALRLFDESLSIHLVQQNKPGMTECLIGIAAAAVASGKPAAGVRLLAAAAVISGQPSASKWKATQIEFERYFGLARSMLSEASFQKEQAIGRTLSLEQAVETAQQFHFQQAATQRAQARLDDLTEREREVAVLIAEGKSNREIAEQLFLSKRTVEKHAANILSKLGLTSRAQVVRWAIETGLVQTSE